jgi:hypothetical protein
VVFLLILVQWHHAFSLGCCVGQPVTFCVRIPFAYTTPHLASYRATALISDSFCMGFAWNFVCVWGRGGACV